MEGFVHSMETFGLVDGPGVRFVVFLQGCRMRCRYCHNPETWKLEGGTPWTADKLFSHVYRYKSYWNKKDSQTAVLPSAEENLFSRSTLLQSFLRKPRKRSSHSSGYSRQSFYTGRTIYQQI